jgi:galactokinase
VRRKNTPCSDGDGVSTFTAHAPGRVNLIGEHTDYNNGFVLPTPIPLFTTAQLEPRADRLVTITTVRPLMRSETFEYNLNREAATGSWADYIKSVTWVLRDSGFAFTGFTLSLRSDIPEFAMLLISTLTMSP